LVELLRQRSRTYLFSNTVAPSIVAGSLKAIDMLQASTEWRDRLMVQTAYFRRELEKMGMQVLPGEHPIVPIMLGDAALANRFASAMLNEGVFVVGFSYPVVPMGKARIRTQISAAHSRDDLDQALAAFRQAARTARYHNPKRERGISENNALPIPRARFGL
jgi:glycine C-acetyltransferase